jgi:hypothetical protein
LLLLVAGSELLVFGGWQVFGTHGVQFVDGASDGNLFLCIGRDRRKTDAGKMTVHDGKGNGSGCGRPLGALNLRINKVSGRFLRLKQRLLYLGASAWQTLPTPADVAQEKCRLYHSLTLR